MATPSDIENTRLSGQTHIDALLWEYPDWNYLTHPAAPNTLLYAFTPNGGTFGNQPLTDPQEAAVRQILAHTSAVTGIRFVETTSAADANLSFGNADLEPGRLAREGVGTMYSVDTAGNVTEYMARVLIEIDNVEYRSTFENPVAGSLGYHVLLHEIGHALGLKHSFEGAITLAPADDHTENTVMSDTFMGGPKSTFQEYDLAALDWLYGGDGLGGRMFGQAPAGGNVIDGTSANDQLAGTSNDDIINGLAGNDTIVGTGGRDRIDGGSGFDVLDLRSFSFSLVVDFSAGTVHNTSFANIERVVGGSAADQMAGAAGSQNLAGQRGNDVLAGGAGNDTLAGNVGADRFVFRETGSANADRIADFAPGVDKIVLELGAMGTTGNFAAGDARFWAAAGATSGHDADDRVIYNTSTGQLFYDADGNNGSTAAQLIATLANRAALGANDIVVEGTSGGTPPPPPPSGTITGTAGNDSLTGTAGNDTIDGLAGADTMNGMGGNDTYYVTAGDIIQDSGGIDRIITSASFALPGPVEHAVLMGSANINSTGNSLANQIMGNSGRNRLDGRGGNDTLDGAAGTDTLVGGTGNDTFVFSHVSPDIVADFATGADKIAFDNIAGFGAIGPEGAFAAGDGRFWAAAGAAGGHDAEDRVIYNTSTGQLYYDADGNGAGSAQLVATLSNLAALSATDVTVI